MESGGQPERGGGTPPGAALNLGINFAVAMGLLAWLGYRMDRHRGGGGYGWTLAGLFLGLLYGGYEVWKLARRPPPRPPASPSPPAP